MVVSRAAMTGRFSASLNAGVTTVNGGILPDAVQPLASGF
jgi:hypothetical protein